MAEDQGERGAKLVADVREERRLRAIERRESLGSQLGLLERRQVVETCRDLLRDQSDEVTVPIVEHEMTAEPHDQGPATNPITTDDGEHQRLTRVGSGRAIERKAEGCAQHRNVDGGKLDASQIQHGCSVKGGAYQCAYAGSWSRLPPAAAKPKH